MKLLEVEKMSLRFLASHPVAFPSKSLSKSQRQYSTSRREMYAVVFFTRYFRHYLVGANFTLRTDHNALLWLKYFKDSDGILARWIERLEAFDVTTVHCPGHLHSNADALSRLPECSSDCFVESNVDSPRDNLSSSVGQATVIPNNTSTELEHLVM